MAFNQTVPVFESSASELASKMVRFEPVFDLLSISEREYAHFYSAREGGRLYRCDGCQKPHFAYHSCNHRSHQDKPRHPPPPRSRA